MTGTGCSTSTGSEYCILFLLPRFVGDCDLSIFASVPLSSLILNCAGRNYDSCDWNARLTMWSFVACIRSQIISPLSSFFLSPNTVVSGCLFGGGSRNGHADYATGVLIQNDLKGGSRRRIKVDTIVKRNEGAI